MAWSRIQRKKEGNKNRAGEGLEKNWGGGEVFGGVFIR